MATKFDDYIHEVEQEAKAGGPEALARWDAFNARYAMAREVRELRKQHKLTRSNSPPSPASTKARSPGSSAARQTRRQHARGTPSATGGSPRRGYARGARSSFTRSPSLLTVGP